MRRKARAHLEQPNLIPLIDILFTIILFFMLTSAIVEGGFQISVPKSKAADSAKQQGTQIAVDEKGVVKFGSSDYADMEKFRTALQPAASAQGEKSRVVIHAHKSIPYEVLMRVMDACKLAGFKTISLAVQPTGAGPAGGP